MLHRILVYAETDRKRDDPNRAHAGMPEDTGYLYGDIVKVFAPEETPNANSTRRCVILEVELLTPLTNNDVQRPETKGEDEEAIYKRLNFVDLDAILAVATLLQRPYRGYGVQTADFMPHKHLTTDFPSDRRTVSVASKSNLR